MLKFSLLLAVVAQLSHPSFVEMSLLANHARARLTSERREKWSVSISRDVSCRATSRLLKAEHGKVAFKDRREAFITVSAADSAQLALTSQSCGETSINANGYLSGTSLA